MTTMSLLAGAAGAAVSEASFAAGAAASEVAPGVCSALGAGAAPAPAASSALADDTPIGRFGAASKASANPPAATNDLVPTPNCLAKRPSAINFNSSHRERWFVRLRRLCFLLGQPVTMLQ
jgi:hypothetical protein